MLKRIIKKIIPDFALSGYHFTLSFFGALLYGFPSKKIKIIAVTGTKGKTTTVELIKRIFEQAGLKTASMSSIRFTIGGENWENKLKMTMPGRLAIQKFLARAVKEKCAYFVFEVTSEGILQHRHRFIKYDAVVFTNLSPEHIEHHGGFEKYREAKGKLFQACGKTHILNLDDKNTEYFMEFPAKEKWGYGFKIFNFQYFQTISTKKHEILSDRIKFSIDNIDFSLKLLGEFNIYNALAAISVAQSQNIGLETCQKALEKINKMPGRMEIVIEEPFRVIVDYAHTPDSLEKVYRTLTFNLQHATSNLICVLGACGGGRDKWKRPQMGKIAVRYCDEIILTNEDPYDESPTGILEDIEKGVLSYKLQVTSYKKILDRREAIKKALFLAKPDDIVIITGKGSECWMCLENNKKIPWSDKQIVLEEFKILKI